jgi:peptidyl-prolyl cis-trans isomerase C
MRKLLLLVIAAIGFAEPAAAQTLAKVGGVPITLQQVVAADPAAANDPAARNKVLVVLVNRQAALNEAKSSGIDQTPDYKRALAQAEQNILLSVMANNFIAAHPISDQQVATTYNEIFNKPAPEQYRFRQIVVSSYSAAQSVITDIKNGQDFSILAATMSEDQSAEVGGEVGWRLASQLPAPILVAMKTLKPEEVAGPISFSQGYVVIQLLGMRPAPKPALDQVKPQIVNALQQQEWISQVVKWRAAQGAQLIVPLSGG